MLNLKIQINGRDRNDLVSTLQDITKLVALHGFSAAMTASSEGVIYDFTVTGEDPSSEDEEE